MATFVQFVLLVLLFAACDGVPIKQQSLQEATYDCYGHCYYNTTNSMDEVNLSLINKTVDILERLETSVDTINRHQEQENNQIETMIELMGKVVDLLEHKISINHVDVTSTPTSTGTITNETSTKLSQAKDLTSIRPILDGTTTELLPGKDLPSTRRTTTETIPELPQAKDCQELADRGIVSSGAYVITPPDGLGSLDVYCDFIDNEGWTVFQRRYDGLVDFYRNWTEYENGFGDSNGEYWLGLNNIHRLISDGNTWALRVDLESFDGESAYAIYDSFSISDAGSNYILSVGEYSGTAGDALKYTGNSGRFLHNGMAFSTHDRDNDGASSNCAAYYGGAWWYNQCYYRANLNARYSSLRWDTWKNNIGLKSSQMKIRRVE